ncbi:MAG: hypothetical protein CSA75_04035 [Sorangium cellulosum]|nr:MAG: hypothetical protein CSA75_04035 [Sorangium cellulosum]
MPRREPISIRSRSMDNVKLKQLGIILLLGGFVLVALALNERRVEGTLFVSQQTTAGHVVDRFISRSNNELGPVTVLRVEYVVDGTKHVIERDVEESYWKDHAKGSKARVGWYGSSFDKAELVGSTNKELKLRLSLGGGLLLLVFGLAALGYDRWRI